MATCAAGAQVPAPTRPFRTVPRSFDRTGSKAPASISSRISGWPASWTSASGINYALVIWTKAYFFKGTEYERFQLSNTAALDKLDPGYPKPIMGYWPGVAF